MGRSLQQRQQFQVESPHNYIEAYRQILMSCADKFFDTTPLYSSELAEYCLKHPNQGFKQPSKSEFLEEVGNNFSRYMHQWGFKVSFSPF